MKGIKFIIFFFFFLSLPGFAESKTEDFAFQVIVNPLNKRSEIDRELLVKIFMKKTSFWDDDGPIKPVDLQADQELRTVFSEEVLKRKVPEMKSYWQRLIFSGRDVPPPELKTEADVVQYVMSNPGAIGYVSRETKLNGTKTLFLKLR